MFRSSNTITLMLLALTSMAGCAAAEPGTQRSLGAVSYDQAFSAGREVLSQYFSVARADTAAGVIETKTEPAPRTGRLLGTGYPARRRAVLRLRTEDGQVIALLAVPVEQLASPTFRAVSPFADTYSTVPNQTPAGEGAALTPEQEEVWVISHYDHPLERQVLADLYRLLHPPTAPTD